MPYPVEEIIPDLRKQLLTKKVVIVQAPPGAGKSTVLPIQLLNEPWLLGKKIILLEPRRLAARSVAQRMADLLKEPIGQTVGYRIRFETKVSSSTRLEVVTEGILTRMIQQDNALVDVGLILFDEFHERSLHADLSLALCYQTQQILRDDLRIIIMSATLDGEKISNTLHHAPIITSLGKQYPVTLKYLAPQKEDRVWVSAAKAIVKALRDEKGDVLVFLPGVGEITRVRELLEADQMGAQLHVLYGDLPFQQQQAALLPNEQGQRKVVLATSIAETSLTIEGVTVVIDAGLARVPRFDPRSGLTRLETIPVTRDAADQRAGRAGRLQPGVCYRLWAEASHQHLLPARAPEIVEADLSSLMLELAQWGTVNMSDLTWITPPPAGAIAQALELLQQLGAIDNGKITTRGQQMARLPAHPRLSHMLLEAQHDHSILALAADIAALLEERDPLWNELSVDLTLRVEKLRKWRGGERVAGFGWDRIELAASAWRNLFKIKEDNSVPQGEFIGEILSQAYPERIARQHEKHGVRYKLANGRVAKLADHDPLIRCAWLAVAQLDAGQTEGRIFMAAPLQEESLRVKAQPHDRIEWSTEKGMIVSQEELRIGVLLLTTKPKSAISDDQRMTILCEAVRQEGLKLLGWEAQHDEWQARIMSLRSWRPQEAWPDVSEESLLNTSDQWLAPFLSSVNKRIDFQRLNLSEILASIIPWDLQQKTDVIAPTRMTVPSGSAIKIHYQKDGTPPVLQVRLQEVFGWLETPSVNEGKNKLLLHLLSPGYKPVQVTQDLKSFWQTTYHEVRKELRMRYPKHHWPEDPWTAGAVRGVKRKS